MKNGRKNVKKIIKFIIVFAVIAVLIVSVIIVNVFIPVKYIGAYLIFGKDEPSYGTMRVRYLNVGYGDCSLVEFPDGKTMLIDGGTGTYANVHMLLKTLNASGIDKIDYLVCTSVKSEHCGSLAELVKYKTVDTAYIPDVQNKNLTDEYAAFFEILTKKGVKTEIAEYGKGVYSHAGYNFYFLSPSVNLSGGSEYDDMNAKPVSENVDAASVVLWIDYSGHGFLFLSDATKKVQDKIAQTMKLEGGKYFFDGIEFTYSDCAVVKTANHCAADSVGEILYDLIKPAASIISVGQNAKNSPSAEEIAVLRLFCESGVLRTDESGTITVTISAEKFTIQKEL